MEPTGSLVERGGSPSDADRWEYVGPTPRPVHSWVLPLGGDTLLAQGNGDMYRSLDGGLTWRERDEVNSNNPSQVLLVPAGPYAGRVVVATGQRNVSFSADRGGSWQSALRNDGTVTDSIAVERVTAITAGPRAGRLVGVGISGVSTSDDGGLTWQKDGPEFAFFQQSANCVATLRGQAPGGGDRVLAVMNDIRVPDDSVRVTMSDDGGETWQRGQGLFPGAFRTCVEAVDLGGGRAVAVMMRGPIWGTEDGGATWTVWSEFLGDPSEDRARWAMVDAQGRLIIGLFEGPRPTRTTCGRWSRSVRCSPSHARPPPWPLAPRSA